MCFVSILGFHLEILPLQCVTPHLYISASVVWWPHPGGSFMSSSSLAYNAVFVPFLALRILAKHILMIPQIISIKGVVNAPSGTLEEDALCLFPPLQDVQKLLSCQVRINMGVHNPRSNVATTYTVNLYNSQWRFRNNLYPTPISSTQQVPSSQQTALEKTPFQ